MTKLIFLTDIDFDASPKVRARPSDDEVINQYAQAYLAKKDLPPIDVFWDKDAKKTYLADGRHRCGAIRKLQRNATPANVHAGDYAAALLFALKANTEHGVQRSPADKRQCVTQAILQWPDKSNRHIAEVTEVDDHTVKAVREEMEKKKKVKPVAVRTDAIGRKSPASRDVRSSAHEAEAELPKPEGMQDILEFPIPKMVQQYWERRPEVQELLTGLSRVMGCLKQAQKDQDPMYGEVNCSGAISDIERAYHNIKLAMPYAVCTSCQGHPETQKKGCRLCNNKGLISEFCWDRLVPVEVKKIRTGK